MNRKIAVDFFNPPIGALPLSYLQDWFGAAVATEGVSKHLWTYLLPRILELLAADSEVCVVGNEVSLRRFDTGNADEWSNAQWSVLGRFQRAYLSSKILNGTEPIDEVLCMFRRGGWALPALLQQLAAAPIADLAERLWRDWCDNYLPPHESIWVDAFWGGDDAARVLDFYTSPALHAKMEALALESDADPGVAEKALGVCEVIDATVRARSQIP